MGFQEKTVIEQREDFVRLASMPGANVSALARRLSRHLSPQDTLARIGGDQFAVLVSRAQSPSEIALFVERERRSLRKRV